MSFFFLFQYSSSTLYSEHFAIHFTIPVWSKNKLSLFYVSSKTCRVYFFNKGWCTCLVNITWIECIERVDIIKYNRTFDFISTSTVSFVWKFSDALSSIYTGDARTVIKFLIFFMNDKGLIYERFTYIQGGLSKRSGRQYK